MSMRAILYARVSTPRQAELYSLEYQLEQERIYAEEMGFVVVAELQDDQSGRSMERDGLQIARDMLARNEADALVTWKLDRLHRSYINTVILRDEIHRLGKELHYAQMRMKSGATAKQRLPEDILALMAEIEVDEITERMQMGKRAKVVKGGQYLGLGRPPFGYRAVGKGRDVHLEIDEEAAAIVRALFTWYVSGDGTSGPMSVGEIADKLDALGIPTPIDLQPGRSHQKQRGYAKWCKTSISRMLRQSAYSGVFYQYRYKHVDGKRRINPREEWQGVQVPQIVDTHLFEAAQEKLDRSRTTATRGHKHEYLVGRRIWCECGYKMMCASVTRDHTLADGTPKRYVYPLYRCPSRAQHRITLCSMPVLSVPRVDAKVWEWVTQEIANPVVLERKLSETQATQRGERSAKDHALQTLYAHKATIEQELKRLATLYLRNDIPVHILDELLAEERQKLKLTEDEIANVEQEVAAPLKDETIQSLVAFAADLQERLTVVAQTFDGRRAVIDGLDVKVVIARDEQGIWLHCSSLISPQGLLLSLSPSSR